jgi:two-component system chemotaxis response regulator CheY
MQRILSAHGECDIAVNGKEAIEAFRLAWEAGQPYDLICLDIMMPEMDGHEVLRHIREIEHGKNVEGLAGAKVIMTTAMGDYGNIIAAFKEQCDAYVLKPIDKQALLEKIHATGLL